MGNTRVDFVADNNKASDAQDYHYYPFGMDFTGLTTAVSDRMYKYNGTESQVEFGLDWYDYGARFYDAKIGRFHTIDRLTEKFNSQSPYVYAGNNPVLYVDINGDFKWPSGKRGELMAERYPVIYRYIKHKVYYDIMKSPELIRQLTKHSGGMTYSQIEKAARWGEGPEIDIDPDYTFYQGGHYNPEWNTITLAEHLVTLINESPQKDKDVALFLFFRN